MKVFTARPECHRRDCLRCVALDLLPQGIVVADEDGAVVAANAAARVLLGLEDRHPDNVGLRCEGHEVSLGSLLRDHAASRGLRRRVELDHPEHGLLEATLTRMRDEEGRVWVHLVVTRSPRRDWRWAGRADPLAAFAHELRNALTSLRETVALLGEGAAGELSEAQRRLLEGMRGDCARMSRLVAEMVATSRVRSGRIRVAAQRVDLGELVREVGESFQAAARRAGVALQWLDPNGEAVCHADRDLLFQALSNLVGNALRHTPEGGVVSLEVNPRRLEGEEFFEVAVRDTGPGLRPEEIEEVLGRSGRRRQGESADGGLGIGLAIVREIAEHHGGRLAAEAQPGVGGCFRVLLPADLRRAEHWRLAQIAESLKVARAVGAPLSVVEMSLRWPEAIAGSDHAHLPLVAHCLEESLRPSDVVLLGERGATLVLYDVEAPGAQRVAERVVGALERLFSVVAGGQGPEVRVGVASYPADGAAASELSDRARARMAAQEEVRGPAREDTGREGGEALCLAGPSLRDEHKEALDNGLEEGTRR